MTYSPFLIFNKFNSKEIDLNEAIEDLISFIDFDNYKVYRIAAIKYLGQIKTNKTIVLEKLKEVLISDGDHHVRGIAAKVLIENFYLESRLIIKWAIQNDKHSYSINTIVMSMIKSNNYEFLEDVEKRIFVDTSLFRVFFIVKTLTPVKQAKGILNRFLKYVLSIDINEEDHYEDIPEKNKYFKNGFNYFLWDWFEMLKALLNNDLNRNMKIMESKFVKRDLLNKYLTPEMEDYTFSTGKRLFRSNYFTKGFQTWYFKELNQGKYINGILRERFKVYESQSKKSVLWRESITKRFQDWWYDQILIEEQADNINSCVNNY